MRGKRTYRKEFQFVGSGTIWRIYDSFDVLVRSGKEKSQLLARQAALETERKLPQVNLTNQAKHLNRGMRWSRLNFEHHP